MSIFVAPGNGQALLGMPDTDVLNIININIVSIHAEDVKNKEQYGNMKSVQASNTKQETDRVVSCCGNTDSI